MENVIAIGVGLTLRTVIDVLTDDDHRLASTIIGLWEGIILSHFLRKNPHDKSDTYLALATRFVIDFVFKGSLVRLALTSVWTLVGLLLADLTPDVWHDTGLRHVYRTLRKDFKAMKRSVPRWRIKNDIPVPNILLSNPVFGLFSPPSTIPSSTRVVPPASPALNQQRDRSPPSVTLFTPVTSSVTNSLAREVLPGPSPALISTAHDLARLNSDPDPRTFPFPNSNRSNAGPSRLNTSLVLDDDDDGVDIVVPSQAQDADPELSALEISPPVALVQATTAGLDVSTPNPQTHINALPHIPDVDLSVHASQVPQSQSFLMWREALRAHAETQRVDSNLGPGFGKAYLENFAGMGSRQIHSTLPANHLSLTGHQRSVSGPTHGETNQSQRSGIPRVRSSGGDARASSALGLTTFSHPSQIHTDAAPLLRPSIPAHQTRLTTSAHHANSDAAGLRSITQGPPPTSPVHAFVQNRASSANLSTDYDPAKDPVRPMPGLGSSTTDMVRKAPPSEAFPDCEVPISSEPPPPFSECEFPVNDYQEGLVAWSGEVVEKGPADEGDIKSSKDKSEGDNAGEVDDCGNQEAGDGPEGAGEPTRNAAKNTSEEIVGGEETVEDDKEPIKHEQEEAGEHKAGGDQGEVQNNRVLYEDTLLAEGVQISGDNQEAGESVDTVQDAASIPAPTVLTPEQKKAESHRAAFILKEVARLEASLKTTTDKEDRGDIQARLDIVKRRIARTNFVDSPDPLPVFHLSTSGIPHTEFENLLTCKIIELLIDRQDAGPITINIISTKKRKKMVDQLLIAFVANNNFHTNSSPDDELVSVVTV